MSYILDALRKSDQLRQRGAAPTLVLGPAPAETPKQPPLLFYGVLALVLLGAGIAIGWLRPWQPAPAAPAAVPARLPDSAPSPAPALTATAPKAEPVPRVQTPAPAVPAPAPARVGKPAAIKTEKRAPPPKTHAETAKAAEPVPQQATRTGADSAGIEPRAAAMPMAELPLAIQQELPGMSISVHAYSDKVAQRLVGINGRLLHQGDDVAPGLKLESITPEGMVLSYKGYRFRHGVK